MSENAPLWYTQILSHELGSGCNLSKQHNLCPASRPDRYELLDTTRELDDDIILNNLKIGYGLGFRGYAAFHFYNEPTLQWNRLVGLVLKMKSQIHQSRALLWTNGTQLEPGKMEELKLFDMMVVSNYFQRDLAFLYKTGVRLWIQRGRLDKRMSKLDRPNGIKCYRPFNELIIDNFGNGHLCCADYRGEISLGNVFDIGYRQIIKNYLKLRNQVAFVGPSPELCRRCWIKSVKPVGSVLHVDFRNADPGIRLEG